MSTAKKKITKKQMKSVKAGQAIPMPNKTNLKKSPAVSGRNQQG